jgi:hypothetical protein
MDEIYVQFNVQILAISLSNISAERDVPDIKRTNILF